MTRLHLVPLPPLDLLDRYNEQVRHIVAGTRNLAARDCPVRPTRGPFLPTLISGELEVSALDVAIPEKGA
jgi:hypothetical protein